MAEFGQELKPGDLIEIFRFGYQHWAIYVGEGYVIHLAPSSEYPGAGSSSIFSVLSSRAVVKWERLQDVVGGCRYRVNNLLDDKYTPRAVDHIIYSAKAKIGQEMEYNVLKKNCEHFVTYLRYGEPESRQVKKATKQISIGGAAFAVLAAIGFMVSRNRHQKQ
ncbi:phospholipase A and acyltransferase 4-like [Meles meles]|uniref:phospholipase A and acyltransferase 4-like n=1 Tax=Meles meles TaxID=9662 RepID=UPI001E69FECB|nr:phospholipase A and acyltransferase 4-like [Meles meles]